MKTVMIISTIIIGAIGLLAINLLIFHNYIYQNKISTYEYILRSRIAKEKGEPFGICSCVPIQ